MKGIPERFLLSKELQVWLFLQPFQHNPTPRPQRPGFTQLTRQPVQVWATSALMAVARPARPAGPRPSPPAPPPEPPGGSPETLPFASGWARSGHLPPPQPRHSPARCREAEAPVGSCRPLRDPRPWLLKSRAKKTARRLRQAPTQQPQQPSWHIRLRGPRPPRRRRVRQRRQRAPRPSEGPSGRPAPAASSPAPFS